MSAGGHVQIGGSVLHVVMSVLSTLGSLSYLYMNLLPHIQFSYVNLFPLSKSLTEFERHES